MCACYLIYYHDLKPWDAIRIMRRQRPGSVERKVQEDTVVMFYNLMQVKKNTSSGWISPGLCLPIGTKEITE